MENCNHGIEKFHGGRKVKKILRNREGPEDFLNRNSLRFYEAPNRARRNPAAQADPITPATFGPIACIRR